MDKQKKRSRKEGSSSFGERKSLGNLRHSSQCLCIKCNPDNKKANKERPTLEKITDFFLPKPRLYSNTKLTPNQRATVRRVARTQVTLSDPDPTLDALQHFARKTFDKKRGTKSQRGIKAQRGTKARLCSFIDDEAMSSDEDE